MSVTAMRGEKILLAKGYGVADRERGRPAKPRTIYQIGSITKQFTAAAVMRLAEQRKLSLDDALTRFLPDYPTGGRTVLVRHLLQQTSGIADYILLPGYDKLETSDLTRPHDELVRLFAAQPFRFAPGERWAYSNSNYSLLASIIEKVTGEPYARHLAEVFFRPLGLRDTGYCDDESQGDRAKGYLLRDGALVPSPRWNLQWGLGDGALCSSAVDLARWNRALVEGRAVSSASYRRMVTPDALSDGRRPEYGFALSVVDLDGRPRVGHGGATWGFTGSLTYYPGEDLTIAVLTNRGGLGFVPVEKPLARAILGLAAPTFGDGPLSASERRSYLGTYDTYAFKVQVVEDGDHLRLRVDGLGPPSSRLLYQGGESFVAETDPDTLRLTFRRATDPVHGLDLEFAGMRWYATRVE